MLRVALLMLCAAVAAPLHAKERTIIDPIPAELVANMNVVAIEVQVADAALEKLAVFDAKAAATRAERKLPAYAPGIAVSADDRSTIPTTDMLPLVMTDMVKEWQLTQGRDVKLRVKLDTIKTANAGMAILVSGSSDQLAGAVNVHDAATDEPLGSFYIDVINTHSGWGGMLVRGSGVREKLDAFGHLLNQMGVSTTIEGASPEDFGRVMTLRANRVTSTVAP